MNKEGFIVDRCAIVILAAGRSARLGQPKQLLPYHGETLLKHAAHAALQTKLQPVAVVLGDNHALIKKELENLTVTIVVNESWTEGIASSVRIGLHTVLKKDPGVDAIIFMVCDQVHVSASVLNHLLEKQSQTKAPIIASAYKNSMGTPALFHKHFFAQLALLSGDKGAVKIIKENADLTETISFPRGSIDIDTPEDYQSLLNNIP